MRAQDGAVRGLHRRGPDRELPGPQPGADVRGRQGSHGEQRRGFSVQDAWKLENGPGLIGFPYPLGYSNQALGIAL